MARRDEIRVSLFPFMSVLACTIGALTLLLTSLSLSAVVPRDAPSRDPVETIAKAAKSSASDVSTRSPGASPAALDRGAIEAVEALLAEVDRRLVDRGRAPGIAVAELESELAAANRRRDLESELARLTKEARAIAAASESVEASIDVLESRRETLPILIDPTGLSRHLDPWFVECDGRGVTAYRASDGYEHFVPEDELNAAGEFGRYLRRLRAIPGALLVLLIRPDGLRLGETAAAIAESAGVRVARLPLPGRGELDWTLLRRAEAASPR